MAEEMKRTLLKCLSEQLSEVELFKSMYPNDNELILSESVIVNVKNFVDGETDFMPKHLDFMLYLKVKCYKLEISVNLSSFYPIEAPDITVRCNQLNRQQETNLNSGLRTFITENHNGEVCVLTIISWIQEHVEGLEDLETVGNIIQNGSKCIEVNDKFVRIWIFSHHIYSKRKREEILSLAKELNLTGFCLPGKPGIICIEGNESSCNNWWKIIKSLTWQKIGIRKTEIFDETERQNQQKFQEFEEIHFQNPSSKHSKHANMSEFSKYIEKHGLSHAFNEIFGLTI